MASPVHDASNHRIRHCNTQLTAETYRAKSDTSNICTQEGMNRDRLSINDSRYKGRMYPMNKSTSVGANDKISFPEKEESCSNLHYS